MDNRHGSEADDGRLEALHGNRPVCSNGFIDIRGAFTPCLRAGLVAGAVIILVSQITGFLSHGRHLNDPLFLALSFGAITRGFLYFNWFGLFASVGAFASFGALSWLTLRLFTLNKRIRIFDVKRSVQVAVLFGMAPVWFDRIDSLMVLFWYAIASVLGVYVADFSGRTVHKVQRWFE